MNAYLYGYIGVGGAFLAMGLLAHKLAGRTKTDNALARVFSSYAPGWTERVVVPILGCSFVILAWPLLVYWKLKAIIHPANTETPPSRPFGVPRDSLTKQLTIEEIEGYELVNDPLDAAPRLPFGHLNARWQTFKQNLLPQDAIWSFATTWVDSDWGTKELREGYVIVRDGTVGPFFLTAREFID